MSWFSDATGVNIQPGKKVSFSKPSWQAQKNILGTAAGLASGGLVGGVIGSNLAQGKTAFGGSTEPSTFGGTAIPDYTSQWETLAQDLQGKKTAAAQEQATAQSMGALADTQNRLAMRGGMSSGASERLAADAMGQRESAWNQLAQAGMLGSADVAKQGLEKKQEMALAIAQGKDMAKAQAEASKPRGLLGGNIIPGIL